MTGIDNSQKLGTLYAANSVLTPSPIGSLNIVDDASTSAVPVSTAQLDSQLPSKVEFSADTVNFDTDSILWKGQPLAEKLTKHQPNTALASPRDYLLESYWPELEQIGQEYQHELYRAVETLFPELQKIKDKYVAQADACATLSKLQRD